MSGILAYHIPPGITSWALIDKVILDPQTSAQGLMEYRFSMYPRLECDTIETIQYKVLPGRIHKSCAFLVFDECYSRNQTTKNFLLSSLGLDVKGPAFLVGGTRLQENKHLFYFDSLPEDYLSAENRELVGKRLVNGWIMRNTPQPIPKEVTNTGMVFAPQEYAWEWHEQQKLIHTRFLRNLLLESGRLPTSQLLSDVACSGCKKTDVKLKRCGDCKLIGYCSKECQKSHRPSHIAFCQQVLDNRNMELSAPKLARTPTHTCSPGRACLGSRK